MSVLQSHTVRCPRCDAAADRQLARSINAERAPQLRQAVLDGTLQRFACEACGETHVGEVRLAYIDFARKIFIDMFPVDRAGDRDACLAETRRALARMLGPEGPPHAKALFEGVQVRTVFGLEALARTVRMLEAGGLVPREASS